jgi:subtilisin family serine protease
LSTTYGGLYGTKCGTSQAAPLVAGSATLLFSQQTNLTNRVVKDLLEETATDLGTSGRDNATGFGLLNIEAPFDFLTPISQPTCRFSDPIRGTVLSGTASIVAYGYSYGDTLSTVQLYVDGSLSGSMTRTTGTDLYSRNLDTTSLSNGGHTLKLRCTDAESDVREVERTYSVTN